MTCGSVVGVYPRVRFAAVAAGSLGCKDNVVEQHNPREEMPMKNFILMLTLFVGAFAIAPAAFAGTSPCKNGKCAPAPTQGPKLTQKGPSGLEPCFNKATKKCYVTDPTDY